MQRIIFCGMLLLGTAVSAQDVTIAGKLPSLEGKTLELSNLSEQKWTITPDASGQFKQTISGIAKGYYSLSNVGTVYLAPGYSIVIEKKDDKITMKGKGSAENNLMREISKAAGQETSALQSGKLNFVSPADYVKRLENFRASHYKLLDKQKGDPAFVSTRKADIDFTIRNLLNEYGYSYGVDTAAQTRYYDMMEKMGRNFDFKKMDSARNVMMVKKMTDEEKKWLDQLADSGTSLNNEEHFKGSAAYRKWIDGTIQSLVYTKYRDDFRNGLGNDKIKAKAVNNDITNPFIRNYLNYRLTTIALKMSDNLQEADSVYTAYTAQNNNSAYGAIIGEIYNKIKKFSKGSPAPDFAYKTVAGEEVTLASLKGNFVYIDVWATWCGPCKAEIPYLKKVEEAYRGKNIKFVSISVDEKKDHDKWKNYVTEKDLQGVQLIADKAFNSTFIQEFNIAAIPRFILIDTEGKIISANASRPSNELLKTELDKLLAGQQ